MGFSVLAAIEPSGVITGFCFGCASTADQPLAESFFALRANPNPRLKGAGSVFGEPTSQTKASREKRIIGVGWNATERSSKKRSWSKRLRRWIAGIRQIVETVYDKLFNAFGLWQERPHEMGGLRARLAAIPWHCIPSASGSTTNSVGPV
jgi:hypothetical protein